MTECEPASKGLYDGEPSMNGQASLHALTQPVGTVEPAYIASRLTRHKLGIPSEVATNGNAASVEPETAAEDVKPRKSRKKKQKAADFDASETAMAETPVIIFSRGGSRHTCLLRCTGTSC